MPFSSSYPMNPGSYRVRCFACDGALSIILEKAVNRRWTPINADRTRRYMSGNVHPAGASASGRNPINLFGILAFIGVHLRFQGLFQEVRDCFATRHAPLAADGSPQ